MIYLSCLIVFQISGHGLQHGCAYVVSYLLTARPARVICWCWCGIPLPGTGGRCGVVGPVVPVHWLTGSLAHRYSNRWPPSAALRCSVCAVQLPCEWTWLDHVTSSSLHADRKMAGMANDLYVSQRV